MQDPSCFVYASSLWRKPSSRNGLASSCCERSLSRMASDKMGYLEKMAKNQKICQPPSNTPYVYDYWSHIIIHFTQASPILWSTYHTWECRGNTSRTDACTNSIADLMYQTESIYQIFQTCRYNFVAEIKLAVNWGK